MLCFWFKFWVFKEIFSTNLGDGLLGLLPHLVELLLAGLQQESNPVGVVVHGEVGQPGAGVGVNHDLVSALNIDDDVLAGHGVLVVVLVVLVEDGGDLLTVLADGKESLLVVVGGNVELEHVGSTAGAGEDAGVDVEAAAVVAVGALEGQVLLTTTVVGLGPIGVEADAQGLAIEGLQECILPLNPGLKVLNVGNAVRVLSVHPVLQVLVGVLAIRDLLADPLVQSGVLSSPGGSLVVSALVQGSNVCLAAVVLALGKVLQVGDGSLASIILTLGKVLQVGDLRLAGVVLSLGPGVESSDLGLPGSVLSVQLAVQLGNVHLSGGVVLLLLLLKRLDLVLAEIILTGGGHFQSIVVLLQLVVVSPEAVDLGLAVSVGLHQAGEGILQLGLEAIAGIEACCDVTFRHRFWLRMRRRPR